VQNTHCMRSSHSSVNGPTTVNVPGRQNSVGASHGGGGSPAPAGSPGPNSNSSSRRSSVASGSNATAPPLIKHASTGSNPGISVPLASPTGLNSSRQSMELQQQNAPIPLKSSEVDMPDGIVDMDAFSQILALDDGDSTREFSKALIWAFCDQAETAVEEMEHFLVKNEIEQFANKAHYLKGSSASLGLMKVSKTCQSIYHTHFIPTLAHFRSYSYQADYSATDSSSSTSSSSSSVPSLDSPMSPSGGSGDEGRRVRFSSSSSSATGRSSSPPTPSGEAGEYDFEALKTVKATALVGQLKNEIREATEWLYSYYQGADAYEANK